MDKLSDTRFWLRTVALVAVAGVGISATLDGANHLPWVLLLLVVFAAVLPLWTWIRWLKPTAQFLVALAEALLAMVGQLLSERPGTLLVLFFVLVPLCARLPRRYSLLCYTLFPLLAALPYLLGPDSRVDWSVVAGVVPGFLAFIAFAEGFWKLRAALEANQKLLDELVAAQRRSEPTAPVNLPDAQEVRSLLTRRDKEVLSLVAMGFSNKEIAERLYLAEGTVKNRVSQLLEKIGARDRTQAALRARDLGVL